MSIFGTVKSQHRQDTQQGSTYILSPTEMTEVVDPNSGEEPYIMKRAELKRALINPRRIDYCTYSIGRNDESYAPLYQNRDDSFHIGCQYFDAEQAKILRKWALDSMTKEEYEQRHINNELIEGTGMETAMRMPCPFCGAPDFIVYKILDVNEALTKGAVCKECDRGMKGILTPSACGSTIEMVQTQGDDAPSYVPPMRRVG